MSSSSSSSTHWMSSSSSSTHWIYDVFVSFREGDKSYRFITQLNYALQGKRISTFIDDKLHKGKVIEPELLQAIEGSRISIVVFSENYTSSERCLDELVKIMKCCKTYGQVVIPVFYDVDPSDVRKQKDTFGEHLGALAGTPDKLTIWKTALTEAANLRGLDARNTRSHYEVIEEIAHKILETLVDKDYLSIPEFLVGFKSRVNELVEFIDDAKSRKRGCTVVEIRGMEGSGKTTMAKLIYNEIHRKFKRRCFIENIRKVDENNNKECIDWQEKFLFGLGINTRNKIRSSVMGRTIIGKYLLEKSALIIFDDVIFLEKLEILCGNIKTFHQKSVIIITTIISCNTVFPIFYGQPFSFEEQTFKTKKMDQNESLELLSLHAFRQARPREDLIKLSTDIAAHCEGLPLTLEVLGSYLFERTKEEWENVLSKLQKTSEDPVYEKLKICYDGLNCDEKEIFHDIRCFFIGKNKTDVTKILKSCGLHPEIAITKLVERSLVKLEKNNKLNMHDLIRDMGRKTEDRRLRVHHKVLKMLLQEIERTCDDRLPMPPGLPKLRCVLVHYHSEFQLSQELRRIMDVLCDVKFTELERTPYPSQISENGMESYLIRMGSSNQVINMLSNIISEGLRTDNNSDFSFLGDNCPYWVTYTGHEHSVNFQVPEISDRCMKGMCIVYSSTWKYMAAGVLIVNYTKCAIQIYKQDIISSFNDEDWQGIISNLRPNDNVEIFVALGNGSRVLKTSIYLIYVPSIAVTMEQSRIVNNMQQSELMNLNFASSSSSLLRFKPRWIYDVLINFCGEDICRNFVSHLHSALLEAGVTTSLDEENLKSEAELKMFQIAIVVFSKTYAESTWCLDELESIVKCHEIYGQTVVPVFYEIDPSDVRHLKGDFGKALLEAVAGKLNYKWTWSRALTKAANFPGLDESKDRNDAELVEEIVNFVLTKLDCPLSITKFPVGLQSRVEKVIEFIKNPSNRIIGIWGMGGSGKTTISKVIYNQIQYAFMDKSFIQDIREVCEKDVGGLVRLQVQLLLDVLKTKVKIDNFEMGATIIQNKLSDKRVLIVLDDVTEFTQLDALCGNNTQGIGKGSVIIITTRNLHLLQALKVDFVYEMDEMDADEALELFSQHAFREAEPREDFNELVRNAVDYCGGLPLALEVIGSNLRGRSASEWRSVLSRLEITPNAQIQKILRISFDGLPDQMEKDIFLYVCCFFIGKDIGYVKKILNGHGLHADSGITVLIERSLMQIDKNNKVKMHHLLQNMGGEIIRQSSTQLRFYKDISDVLTKNTGT